MAFGVGVDTIAEDRVVRTVLVSPALLLPQQGLESAIVVIALACIATAAAAAVAASVREAIAPRAAGDESPPLISTLHGTVTMAIPVDFLTFLVVVGDVVVTIIVAVRREQVWYRTANRGCVAILVVR